MHVGPYIDYIGLTSEPEIEYTFPKTKHGKLYYKELIGKERLDTKRKTRSVGKKKSTSAKSSRAKKSA